MISINFWIPLFCKLSMQEHGYWLAQIDLLFNKSRFRSLFNPQMYRLGLLGISCYFNSNLFFRIYGRRVLLLRKHGCGASRVSTILCAWVNGRLLLVFYLMHIRNQMEYKKL